MPLTRTAGKTTANGKNKTELDRSALHHLFGFMSSLADTKLRKAFFKHMAPLNLRPVEFTILVLLQTNELVTQKKLCQAIDSPAPNLVVILDRLRERGLIARLRSEEDRREQHLTLTDTGNALVTEARVIAETMENEVVQVLTPGEQMMLFELLDKLGRGASSPA